MRKNIDLEEEEIKILSVLAAYEGKDLKNFIQDTMKEIARKALKEGKVNKEMFK